ncbi:MAG: oxidoreductase [Dehalobacter sp.]|nr:oxidoreductase [Dehalobacter sp.]
MSNHGLLIDYQYCSGCKSCEIACKNEKELPIGKWGIKVLEMGPWEFEPGTYEWNYIPTPTSYCDLCADRVAEGNVPSCVLHCLASAIEYGTIDELSAKMKEKGEKVYLIKP